MPPYTERNTADAGNEGTKGSHQEEQSLEDEGGEKMEATYKKTSLTICGECRKEGMRELTYSVVVVIFIPHANRSIPFQGFRTSVRVQSNSREGAQHPSAYLVGVTGTNFEVVHYADLHGNSVEAEFICVFKSK